MLKKLFPLLFLTKSIFYVHYYCAFVGAKISYEQYRHFFVSSLLSKANITLEHCGKHLEIFDISDPENETCESGLPFIFSEF